MSLHVIPGSGHNLSRRQETPPGRVVPGSGHVRPVHGPSYPINPVVVLPGDTHYPKTTFVGVAGPSVVYRRNAMIGGGVTLLVSGVALAIFGILAVLWKAPTVGVPLLILSGLTILGGITMIGLEFTRKT